MGETLVLKAQLRENTGSKHAAKLRAAGLIPAVVYGHKQEPVTISLDAHDFVEGLHHGYRLIDVKIGRKKQKMLVKDLQYDHLGRKVIHADLMRVDVEEVVKVMVPVELKGTAAGTHEGGIIEEHVDKLEVACKVAEIPESIVVRVNDVHVGDALHAGDVELPEGIELVSPPDTLIVTCHLVAAAKTTEEIEEEAPAAPEVISEAEKGAEEGADEQG